MEKRIIATAIPVLMESVKNDFSAKLFKYRDIDDLKEKIIWAIENPTKMKEYAENARLEAEKRFDIEIIAQQHEDLYNEVRDNYKGNK